MLLVVGNRNSTPSIFDRADAVYNRRLVWLRRKRGNHVNLSLASLYCWRKFSTHFARWISMGCFWRFSGRLEAIRQRRPFWTCIPTKYRKLQHLMSSIGLRFLRVQLNNFVQKIVLLFLLGSQNLSIICKNPGIQLQEKKNCVKLWKK